MLTLSFAPFDIWPLAYVALLPWLVALHSARGTRGALLLSWAAGVVFWTVSCYWLWWITLVGYAAAVLYLSLYWLAAAALLRAAMRKRWPMWLTLPVVWVALEYARAYVISGFPWFYLAHSQWSVPTLIQVSDLTGQYGLSFLVAMANGALADAAIVATRGRLQPLWKPTHKGRIAVGWVVAGLALAAVIVYGRWRLAEQTTSPGPVVAVVQHAYPISVAGERTDPDKILSDFTASSEKLAGAGADLLVWPETMLPAGLNREVQEANLADMSSRDLRLLAARFYNGVWDAKYSDETILANLTARSAEYAEKVADVSRKAGCPLLAGGTTVHRNPYPPVDADDIWVTRNSAMLFEKSPVPEQIYSKVHLVPFGEYVPFKRSWTWLHRTLRSFVPAAMDQLDSGERFSVFQWRSGGRQWRAASPICYEGTFARVCRAMVMGAGGQKRVDLLANISNDGWFVYRRLGEGAYQGSCEQAQHLVQYCFRAVENRVPVVRAVNTGISASIDSNGRVVSDVGTSIDDYRRRTMISGTMLLDGAKGPAGHYAAGHGPQVLVDRRVSLYSQVGDVFAMVVSVVAVLAALTLGWGPAGRLVGLGGGRRRGDARKRKDSR
jgi:apolipoprotein N-acyltransferase